ncbi:MAG: aminotransferase class I/II-fold pyridoxal phosphate-dependent enzyme [Pseudomonadota bacterium]
MRFDRFDALPEYAFPRLRALLDGAEPGAAPIDMSIGEPKHAPPAFLKEVLSAHFGDYRRYPPVDGDEPWREAVFGWAARRYGWDAARLSAEAAALPLSGTREGLFMAALATIPARIESQGASVDRPAVLLPNPFYQCYAAAAIGAGAEPVYLSASAQTDWLPSLDQPEALWRRAQAMYLCSPSNPQGAVASPAYWRRLLGLAERYDFMVYSDECYSEIYRGAAPTGVLAEARAIGSGLERVLAFHSLSKRSNLAGLRAGFVMGGRKAVDAVRRLKAYAGAPCPIPALRAAEAAWRDETHVAENRARYVKKFETADRLFTNWPSYQSPTAGFFLWLRVEDGEAAAQALWREEGVKALPGAYLSRRDGAGVDPGAAYLRVALVEADEARVEEGLTRVSAFLRRSSASERG